MTRSPRLVALAVSLCGLCAVPPAGAQPRPSLDCADAPAAPPPGLVVGLVRRVVPHGRAPVTERAELTDGAPCEPGIPACVTVSTATLHALYAALRVRLGHDATHASPHYGVRTLYARWAASRCELVDAWSAPVSRADRPRFERAFDAVLAAFAAAR